MKPTILLFSGLTLLLAASVCACNRSDDPERPVRDDYIKVYEVSAKKTVDAIQIPFEGVQDGTIHVLSNVALEWRQLIDPSEDEEEVSWLTIKSVEEVEPGHIVVSYDAEPLIALNALDRRSSRLSFFNEEESLGKFLPLRQGYSRQFMETFDDEDDKTLVITGSKSFTTPEYPKLNADYFDYIAFNAWAETTNEFISKNITLDVTISGGRFYETEMTTFRVNVPIGTAADKSNFKYLLVMGNDGHMSPKTHFTFSVANDNDVFVHIDNFAAYKVTEAEMGFLFEDEEFDEDEEVDWI